MVCCYLLWVDILIPLISAIISAIIGGALTFLGVYYTIKKQQEKENKNEKLKYKPYLKISQSQCKNEIFCIDSIKHTFDQDNIDFEKTKFFYTATIQTFYITNGNNAECLIKEIIIDDQKYKLKTFLLSKNESIGIAVTGNFSINLKESIKNICLVVADLLGNKYYCSCEYKITYDKPNSFVEYPNGKKLNVINSIYKITNINLPVDDMNIK
ncbi:MAG: hypothetical protein IKT33_02875 [Clostridia bacterium]|nr:hypothetical protein [Clostridia bacterium]